MVVAAVVAFGWVAQQAGLDLSEFGLGGPSATTAPSSFPQSRPQGLPSSDEAQRGPGSRPDSRSDSRSVSLIEEAARSRRSGFMVTVDAPVVKVLRDDNNGSRHQRFLIELETGRTLLVAHNIDLAKRIPLREGDPVRVRGQYEWNEKGGVLHWTHHDPDGSHEGGWIEHRGQRTE
jgi:hypothetical protein